MKKAIILLSAGLDSLAALSQTILKYNIIEALTFDYGQRAAKKEIYYAGKIAKHYKIPHRVIKLEWLRNITDTALVNRKKIIPNLKSIEDGSKHTAKSVWVPNRNGVFINIAAAIGESKQAKYIITGFNSEEAVTFPDNSLEFCLATEKALSYSTQNKIKVLNVFYNKDKTQIMKIALKNKAPLKYAWPCYEGRRQFCGVCESCVRFNNAFKNAGGLAK